MTPTREAGRRRARHWFLALAASAVLCGLAPASRAQPAEPDSEGRARRAFDLSVPHRPDELVVGLPRAPKDPETTAEHELRREAIYESVGIRVLAYHPRIRVVLLQIPPPGGDEELQRVAAKLAAHPDLFEYVDPNRLVHLEQGTPDPKFQNQWALPRIEASQAWNVTKGDAGVVVAVIDSGIASDLDLRTRLWVNPCEGAVADGTDNACAGGTGNGYVDDLHGWSFVGTGSSDLADQFDHGTQVAGVIGAIHDNGHCIKGVAGNVSLMPLKVSGMDGIGDVGRIVAALAYAVDASADVVNASWSTDWDQSLLKALQDAGSAGILVVAAAGRGELPKADLDTNVRYPCSYRLPNVLCVAATKQQGDGLEDGSSWGKLTVHLGAPGEAIYSTARAGDCTTRSGTSMAVPHVVGVAVLIESKCNGATVEEVRSRVLQGDAVSALSAFTSSGTRLNARRAVEGPCTPRVVRWLRRGFDRTLRPFRRSAPAAPVLLE